MEYLKDNNTILPTNEIPQDNTTTFLIGFGILLIFVIVGIIASLFLCLTLKKDQYLWEVERERQLSEKRVSNDDIKENDDDNKIDSEVINIWSLKYIAHGFFLVLKTRFMARVGFIILINHEMLF